MKKGLLSGIDRPEDIKGMTTDQLKTLSDEIRQRIIDVLAVNGGHLASNLGIVELTLALHYVFNSPKDKFIWDVSHQSYVHKLLTGRKERFHTIRQTGGLCGFCHPRESEHDHFHAGHAGTAMSLALGVATTRDLKGDDEYVIPVIGDATLTCGMSLEAMNNIDRHMKKFIIVLNDNNMSISKNVGAIKQILSRMVSNPNTHKFHEVIDAIVEKMPYGEQLIKQGHRFTGSLKNLFSPAAFFEQYGVSYIGPIDGHDVERVIDVFEGLKESSSPVLVHVITTKGKGLEEAAKSPVTHHGAKPFNPETGKFLPNPAKKDTYPKIFGKQILKMAEEDPSIVAVTPAMSFGSCLDPMMKKFPDRCLDVGIAESHAVTFCGGLAYQKGMKIVSSIYATFLQRALDNLFHDVCLQELPVVFAIDRGGLSAADGATHHGIYDISFLNAMPNMIITQPRDGKVLRELLLSAFDYGRPTAIRYPNMAVEDPEGALERKEIGKGEILAEGKEFLLIALGHMNKTALEVHEKLKSHGITATIFDPVFVKPLDQETLIRLLLTHDRIITLEEHSVVSGLGSIVNHFLVTQGFTNVQVLNLGIPEEFVQHGSYSDLIRSLGLSPDEITEKIIDHFSLDQLEERGEEIVR